MVLHYVIDEQYNIQFKGSLNECIDFVGMNIEGYYITTQPYC